MCKLIVEHAEDWPATKLHRWVGFVQAGMIANYMLDLDGAKAMFNKVKEEYGSTPRIETCSITLTRRQHSRWKSVVRVDATHLASWVTGVDHTTVATSGGL